MFDCFFISIVCSSCLLLTYRKNILRYTSIRQILIEYPLWSPLIPPSSPALVLLGNTESKETEAKFKSYCVTSSPGCVIIPKSNTNTFSVLSCSH